MKEYSLNKYIYTSIYIIYIWMGELLMGFQDVAFCPPELVLPLHFLKIVMEVKASGPSHISTVLITLNTECFVNGHHP